MRPPSRFASVIDRLLRNQNPLENRNNLRSSSLYLVLGRLRATAPQFCGSEIHGDGSHSCSDHRCSVRAFDDSTARRLAAAASRGPRPGASRAGWRLRQSAKVSRRRRRVARAACASVQKQLLSCGSAHCNAVCMMSPLRTTEAPLDDFGRRVGIKHRWLEKSERAPPWWPMGADLSECPPPLCPSRVGALAGS